MKQFTSDYGIVRQRRELVAADSLEKEPQKKPLRRPNPPPLSVALIPTTNHVLLRLAEELEFVVRTLDLLGEKLVEDRNVVSRHAGSIQAIDSVGQILGHIAAVSRSSAPIEAIKRIGMVELRARLLRGSISEL